MSWWELFRQATHRMSTFASSKKSVMSQLATRERGQWGAKQFFVGDRQQTQTWKQRRAYLSARTYWQKSSANH